MTISAQGVRAVYPGAGSAGPFTLQDADTQAILFASNAEIVVTVFDEDGVPDILTLTLEYSLTGAGSPTAGNLTLVSVLPVGHSLVIQRVTPRTQLIDLISGGKLAMTTLENMLDKLIRIDQEDLEASQRTISFSSDYTGDQIFFPLPNEPGDDDLYLGFVDGEIGTLAAPFMLRSGAGAPSASLGNDGDFYINTSALTLYGPKTAGAWGSPTSMQGPTGPQGPEGIPGGGGLTQGQADLLYQPLDSDLTSIAALTTTSIGRSLLAAASAAAIATIAGLGPGDSPQFTAVNIGAATDTTLTRVSAGVIAIEGSTLLTTVTGQPLDADLTAIAALTTTSFGRSVLDRADAAALATLAGVGTGNSPQFTGIELGAATDTTITRASAGTIAVEGQNVLTAATGQPLDADLTSIAALTTTSIGRSVLAAASAAAIATIAGVGTGDSPQVTALNIGAATDTTLARVSAGVISVEGVTILTTATGQPLDADLTAIAALTTTSFGRSALDRADAAALATLAGVGTANNPQFATVELGAATDTTLSRSSAGVLAVEGVVVPTISSTNTLTNKTIAFGSNTISGITGSILFNIDGGGSAITTGVKGYLPIPFGCTITGWTLLGDVSGSCVVDIWKDTYANYPPVVGDTITAAAKPTISSAVKGQSSTLTGWTTTITSGDVLGFNIDSNATITKLSIELKITRT